MSITSWSADDAPDAEAGRVGISIPHASARITAYYVASVTTTRWDAILRCQTWNIWPERFSAELSGVPVEYGADSLLLVDVVVDAYSPRSTPARYVVEETNQGPPLWDGELQGLHHVWDSVLKAPEDIIPLTTELRRARSGELDIILYFEFDGDPLPDTLVDALRAAAYEMMALLNIELGDFLTPALPFQVRRLHGDDRAELVVTHTVAVQERHDLVESQLEQPLVGLAHFLVDSQFGGKLRVALELYAAHFRERQVRVRFILLVIAMEALAEAGMKDQAALNLLSRWRVELDAEKAKHNPSSEASRNLVSLAGQLGRLGEEPIGAQIGKLFAGLPGVGEDERAV